MKSKLKLYLVSQEFSMGYDTWDSAVVAAMCEEDAKSMHPERVAIQHVSARFLGFADKSITEPEMVCGSFNAG